MIEKLVRKLNQFYHFSFLLIMVATMGAIFYFWKSGFVDGSRSKELHKTNYILEQVESQKPLKEIRQSIYAENSKVGIEKLNDLEKNLEKINKLVEHEDFAKIKKESGQLKTSIANLISFSKTSKIISVFNGKLTKFNNFVERNKWRTLTRTSNRVLSLTKGHINKKKLSRLVNIIEKDFKYMVRVTEKSILTGPEKSEILSRISNLEVETNMLKKYISERDFFYGTINSFSKHMNSWLKTISPELSYQRLQVEQMGRYYIMALFGILALASLLFFSSFAYQKVYRKNAQASLEDFMEEYLSSGIIEHEKVELESFSDKFQAFSNDIVEYAEKRMSYGSIFQKALPLSSLMLDKNLKVKWANKQFCENWNLSEDEINKDYLSWDYLAKLTNLADNDPVLEALKHGIAGIYQVQIKVDEKSDVVPYEMFVSPVEYNDETKIMLFFYPLAHLHETIKDQAKTINNPIEKTLRLIASNEFTNATSKELQKDYDIAGISPLLGKFENIVDLFKSEQSRLIDQIEVLYQKINVLESKSEKISSENSKIFESNKGQVSDLKAFKENVIAVTTVGKQTESLAANQLNTINSTLNAFNSSLSKAKELRDIVEQLSVTMPKFANVKEDIKTQKSLLSDTKMRLSHSLSQMIHVKKKITDPAVLERFNNSYERVGSEFKAMDAISTDLEKRLTNLEVVLSKGQIVLNDINLKIESLSVKNEQSLAIDTKNELELFRTQFESVNNQISLKEDEIVANLKSLYSHTKQSLRNTNEINLLAASVEAASGQSQESISQGELLN